MSQGKNLISAMSILLDADTTEMSQEFKNAEKTLRQFGRKMEGIGKTLSASITAPLVGIGAVSVNAFANFDDAMTKSTAIMGNLSAEMKQGMERAAMDVAKTTTFSATQSAEAFYFLASAGYDASQAIAALPQVAAFAQAGAFDMAKATELAADAQSALGLRSADAQQNLQNLARVTDVLVKANVMANASVEQFSASLTNKAAAALRALGKDMEEGVAVLAAFADQGIKGDRAGEGLSIMLRDLQKAGIENAKVFSQLGVTVFDQSGEMRAMADIIGDLERALGGMSDQQRQSTITALGFTDGSIPYINALVGMSDKLRDYETQLRGAGGTTDEVANNQMQSFSAQMKLLRNNLELAGISIGKVLAPAIAAIAVWVRNATERFNSMSEFGKGLTVTLGVIAASIGPVIIGLGAMISGIKNVTAALTVARVAMVAHPILAIASILATAAVAAQLLTGNISEMTEKVRKQLGLSKSLTGSEEEQLKIRERMIVVAGELREKYDELSKISASSQLGINMRQKVQDSINALKDELDALSALGNESANTTQRSAEMRAELERVKKEMDEILAPTTAATQAFVKLGDAMRRTMSMPMDMKLSQPKDLQFSLAPDPKSMAGLDAWISAYDAKIAQATSDAQRRDLAVKREGFLQLREEMQKSVDDAKRTSADFANEFNMNIAPVLVSALGGIAGAFVEMTTASLLSGGSMTTVFYGVLGSLADLAVQVGKMAIGIGLAIEGIKTALSSLNPLVAVAAGAALVALGTAAKIGLANLSKPKSGEQGQIPALADGGIAYGRSLVEVGEYAGARANPEVIMPLDKLNGLIGGKGNANTVVVTPTMSHLAFEGEQLVAYLEWKSKKMKRTHGRGISL